MRLLLAVVGEGRLLLVGHHQRRRRRARSGRPDGVHLGLDARRQACRESALVQCAQEVDGHLENLGLLQLGRALLLEGGRHEPPQLTQGVVDLIAAPLLDHAAPLLAAGQMHSVGCRGRIVLMRHYEWFE